MIDYKNVYWLQNVDWLHIWWLTTNWWQTINTQNCMECWDWWCILFIELIIWRLPDLSKWWHCHWCPAYVSAREYLTSILRVYWRFIERGSKLTLYHVPPNKRCLVGLSGGFFSFSLSFHCICKLLLLFIFFFFQDVSLLASNRSFLVLDRSISKNLVE